MSDTETTYVITLHNPEKDLTTQVHHFGTRASAGAWAATWEDLGIETLKIQSYFALQANAHDARR